MDDPGRPSEQQLAMPSTPLRPTRLAPVRLGTLRPLLSSTAAVTVPLGAVDIDVTGVSSDSADIAPGDLFVALPGSHGHGARFAGQAVARGAVAVLTDPAGVAQLDSAQIPVLLTESPRSVLGAVSAVVFGNPSRALNVVGITGTSGKTTTTALVQAGVAAAGLAGGTIGTLGVFLSGQAVKTSLTTPEAPQLQALLAVMAERGVQCVTMEVSSHALRLGRVDGISFKVGAFTNLSQDHLDFHTDMADYFAAKSLLFDGRATREVVSIDDEWGRRLVTPDTVTVSTSPSQGTWQATEIVLAADGSSRFTVLGPGLEFEAGCRIPGRYNVGNTLLALAILDELGVDPVAAAPALRAAQVAGRMQAIERGQGFRVVVDYSHKPAGVAAALQALRPLTAGRLIIVLGCGGDRDRAKRPIMGEVAARDSDVLFVTDDNPRSEDPAAIRAAMLAGARAAGGSGEVVEDGDRRSAIRRAIGMARDGDTVLIAGKGHETGQQVGDVMLPFDDVSVATDALIDNGFDAPTPGDTYGRRG